MSFRCEHCKTQNPRTAAEATSDTAALVTDSLPRRVVIEYRPHTHPRRTAIRMGEERTIDRGGKGPQIAKEMNLCTVCADYFAIHLALTVIVPQRPVKVAKVKVTEAEKARMATNAFAALAISAA